MDSLKRELQVLSEQYSQKCLEIGELTQKAEEREQTLQRCQQEGKELLRKNQAREGISPRAETAERVPPLHSTASLFKTPLPVSYLFPSEVLSSERKKIKS